MIIIGKNNFENWFTITYFCVENIESKVCSQTQNVVFEKFHRENSSFISMNRLHNLLWMVNIFYLKYDNWKGGGKCVMSSNYKQDPGSTAAHSLRKEIDPLINPLHTIETCSDKTYYYNIWNSIHRGYIPNFTFIAPILTELFAEIV